VGVFGEGQTRLDDLGEKRTRNLYIPTEMGRKEYNKLEIND
jgi:hypothetical protein